MEHLLELLSDPAHLAFELIFSLVFDVLILGLLWPIIRGMIKREHRRIDAEHGVNHDENNAPDVARESHYES